MGRPFRLVDYRHVLHFDRREPATLIPRQCPGRHWNNPVKPRARDRRMEVMHLIFRTELATEKRQSNVAKRSGLRCPRCPVFTIHDAEVGRLDAEQDRLALTIGARAVEPRTPSHSTFEIVDVRRFQVRSCRLVVATVHVQPGNRERIG